MNITVMLHRPDLLREMNLPVAPSTPSWGVMISVESEQIKIGSIVTANVSWNGSAKTYFQDVVADRDGISLLMVWPNIQDQQEGPRPPARVSISITEGE